MTNDEILRMIKQALDEIESQPLDVSLRRTLRIANLMGESDVALRITLDLRPPGGSPTSNRADLRRLMAEENRTDDTEIVEKVLKEYIDDRKYASDNGEDRVNAHSVSELIRFQEMLSKSDPNANNAEIQKSLQWQRSILDLTRMRAFVNLCSWERRLNFTNTNEGIFRQHQNSVDQLLEEKAPEVLASFSSVYRRLRDARLDSNINNEELSQALTSCRRVLKAVTDHVYPPTETPGENGEDLTDEKYKNRIRAFIQEKVNSKNARTSAYTVTEGVYERFSALNNQASKGVHANITRSEAELCAIHTYLLAGEILRINEG